MKRIDIVEELTSIILTQEKELERLRLKIKYIQQYIEVYEDYIKKGE